MLKVEHIGDATHPLAVSFLEYCKAYGKEHDDSFIPGQDWSFGDDYPSCALVDSSGTVAGAAAFIANSSFRATRKARVAVLHALAEADAEAYGLLCKAGFAVLPEDIDECYLFVPELLPGTIATLKDSGFSYERTVFLMEARVQASRSNAPVTPGPGTEPGPVTRTVTRTGTETGTEPLFPEGYTFRQLESNCLPELEDFIKVRNRNFRELKGSSDARVEDLQAFTRSAEYLPGGLILLQSPDGQPCGTLRLEHDDEEKAGFIGTISVDKEHRSRGLGRALVRFALSLANQNGFNRVFLAVNTDNRSALDLYLSEGFSIVKAMTCMNARIH